MEEDGEPRDIRATLTEPKNHILSLHQNISASR